MPLDGFRALANLNGPRRGVCLGGYQPFATIISSPWCYDTMRLWWH